MIPMTRVVVKSAFLIPPGVVVRLNETQASARKDALQANGKNGHIVKKPVQFKKGELLEIGLTGLPKILQGCVSLIPVEAAA